VNHNHCKESLEVALHGRRQRRKTFFPFLRFSQLVEKQTNKYITTDCGTSKMK
jgi:hypothetical protein